MVATEPMKWHHFGPVSWAQLAGFYRGMGWKLKDEFPSEKTLLDLATWMAGRIEGKVGSRSTCGRLQIRCEKSIEYGCVVYHVEAEGPLAFEGFSEAVREKYSWES